MPEKKIKTITQFTAGINTIDEIPSQLFKRKEIVFNENKLLLRESVYFEDGEIESEITHTYNDKGQIITETNYYYENEVMESREISRDSSGKIKEVVIHYGQDSFSIEKFEYNDKKVVIRTYDEDNEIEEIQENHFNASNELILNIKYDSDNQMVSRTGYEYIEENLRRKVEENPAEDFYSETVYEYNDQKNLVSVTAYTQEKNIINQRIITYNSENQIIEENIDGYRLIYQYDEKGRNTREETWTPAENILNFTEYKYNDDGTLHSTIIFSAVDSFSADSGRFSGSHTPYLLTQYQYDFYN